MKQLFEAFLGTIFVMLLSFCCLQLLLVNMQISTAKQYTQSVVEKIENSGLDDNVVDDIITKTNESDQYQISITPVSGYEDKTSYHIVLTYVVNTPIFDVLSKQDSTQKAKIDAYASVGGNYPKTTASLNEKHGNVVKTISIGSGVTAEVFADGYTLIEGSGVLSDGYSASDNAWSNEGVENDITSIRIDADITEIPKYFFYGLENLKYVNLGDKITSIGAYAFSNCNSLKDVTIPNSVQSVGAYAFSDCNNLMDLYVDNSVKNVTVAPTYAERSRLFKDIIFLR